MRGSFSFDPAQGEYGSATVAIRQIFAEWAAIDWFVPPLDPTAAARAAELFRKHNEQGRLHQPELFPERVETGAVWGSWPGFAALSQRVRAQSWDWKFSILKKLSGDHAEALGWTLDDQVKNCAMLAQGVQPRPGDLFFRFGEHVMWTGMSPKLDLRAIVPREYVEAADWYLSYAHMDMLDCLQWQLAEDDNRLERNPFLPLLRCYAAGFYPFSLSLNMVDLFAFA